MRKSYEVSAKFIIYADEPIEAEDILYQAVDNTDGIVLINITNFICPETEETKNDYPNEERDRERYYEKNRVI